MKKPLFIAGIIVCTSLVVLFTALHLNESDSHQESEANFRPHIMVRNQIYWLSAYPCNEGRKESLHTLARSKRRLSLIPNMIFKRTELLKVPRCISMIDFRI